MADYADSTSKDRGRRPDPRDEDHTRDPSPDRAETPEQRGRKSRDNQEDHEREFSHKELAQREDHKGQNWGNNQRWQGQDRRGYGRGHEQYYDQNSQYYPRGRGHHPQQGRGRGYQGGWGQNNQQERSWNSEGGWGQNNQQEWQGNRSHGRGGQGHREHYNHKDRQQGRYDRYQSENGEGRQESHGGRRRDEDPVVFLSKKLSFILRHGAEKMGFKMMPGGFLWVDEILRRNEYRDFTVEDIKHIVETNDKQRFSLADENGRLKIRANQGHSVEVDGLELTPIKDPSEAPEVIHGTYLKSWDIIKNQGLNKMGRNHIHFAAGEPGENGVISGMRSSCEVIIKLNMEKALKDGLKFFRSANNVILSPGDADGFIRPCYFDSAFQRYPRGILPFNSEIKEGPTIPGLSGDLGKGKKKKNKKKQKEEREGEKVKKEKSETGEQEVNMEGATSMFSEGSPQAAVQETEKTAPQASEERLSSDGGTQDRPSIPGLSGNLAREDKKNKKKNKGNKNSEEASKEATNMAATQTQENVPESWDGNTEDDKSNNAANSAPEKLLEFTFVEEEYCCRSAVEELKSTGPVFVYCHLEGEEVTYVVCVSETRAFNFKTELLAEGDLNNYLNTKSSEAKIFNSIADTSKVLFDNYSIILDGTNPFDNMVALKFVDEMGLGDKSKLPQGFDSKDWGSLAVGPELLKKCKVSLQAYEHLSSWIDSNKTFKRLLFEEVNKKIDKDKLKAEKQKRKEKGNQKPAAAEPRAPTDNKGKNKKRKGKK